ncbi:MAG TPA: C1 family peptidase [Chitinophagaceae bacterium]|jgi:C1A family cysteine protease|nr:C1 family peptidase [Chitinophagaceae bacterium]
METLTKKPAGKKIVVPVKIAPIKEDDKYYVEMDVTEKRAMGWLPDYPDFRDYDLRTPEIKEVFRGTKLANGKLSLPASVDLRPWCSPVENQGSLGSCTANAGVGLIEYFERRAFGNYIDGSRLFLYKATRNYMQVTGDTGAYLRTTMGAMVLFGVVPEKYWPYNIAGFDIEPPAFCYSFANNFKTIKYFRLDPAGTPKDTVLNNVKTNLAAGLPGMFGFSVYNSFYQAQTTGKVPMPASAGDPWVGGHAVDVVGYDDTIRIKNSRPGSVETVGALLIRNSWGAWGPMGGYLWMPYDFILKGLATDFWTLISSDYVNTGAFNI